MAIFRRSQYRTRWLVGPGLCSCERDGAYLGDDVHQAFQNCLSVDQSHGLDEACYSLFIDIVHGFTVAIVVEIDFDQRLGILA